jgi:hypothetical protein
MADTRPLHLLSLCGQRTALAVPLTNATCADVRACVAPARFALYLEGVEQSLGSAEALADDVLELFAVPTPVNHAEFVLTDTDTVTADGAADAAADDATVRRSDELTLRRDRPGRSSTYHNCLLHPLLDADRLRDAGAFLCSLHVNGLGSREMLALQAVVALPGGLPLLQRLEVRWWIWLGNWETVQKTASLCRDTVEWELDLSACTGMSVADEVKHCADLRGSKSAAMLLAAFVPRCKALQRVRFVRQAVSRAPALELVLHEPVSLTCELYSAEVCVLAACIPRMPALPALHVDFCSTAEPTAEPAYAAAHAKMSFCRCVFGSEAVDDEEFDDGDDDDEEFDDDDEEIGDDDEEFGDEEIDEHELRTAQRTMRFRLHADMVSCQMRHHGDTCAHTVCSAGAYLLAAFLPRCPGLQRLGLARAQLTDFGATTVGVQQLMESVGAHASLTALDVSNTFFHDAALEPIGRMLRATRTLRSLRMVNSLPACSYDTTTSTAGCRALVAAVRANRTLEDVEVSARALANLPVRATLRDTRLRCAELPSSCVALLAAFAERCAALVSVEVPHAEPVARHGSSRWHVQQLCAAALDSLKQRRPTLRVCASG